MDEPSGTQSLPAAARPRRLSRVAGLLALVVLVGLVAGYLPRWRQRAALRAETAALATLTVTAVSPVPGKPGAGLTLPAEINALVEAPIHARANGYVKRWLVDIGAQVKAGQLMAEIEAPELVQELERARAEFGQAEAALALAKTTASRFAELVKSGSVGEQETAEKEADFRVKSATADAARANVRRLQELLSYTRVTAPFEGTVTARKTDVGDLVVAGGNKELFRLAQTRTLRVFVRVPQAWSRAVAVGQAADLVIPELPGRAFPAKVVRTAGAMAEESRTLLVELEVDNGKHEILAGSYGEVRFVDAKRPAALTLPPNALLLRAEGPQAAVVQANGRVELRGVKLGRDSGQTIEILEGLAAADQVVLNPPDSLVSGTAVRVAKPAAGERAP
jgi:RND family efflux transporter MFP subunit